MRDTSTYTTPSFPSPPSPDSRQDRAGTLMPKNIAQLLYVLGVLLEYGRHLVATIERRAAAPGFSLFSAVFGTARLPLILGHLHRGILRATALESLLRKHAAGGHDVEAAPLRIDAASNAGADPMNECLGPQAARLAAERAAHDAPVDPDHLPTLEEIEAEVRHHPIGRTIAAICRDLGVVPIMCTRMFWDATTAAIAGYETRVLDLPDDTHSEPESSQHEPEEDDPEQKQTDQGGRLSTHRTPGFGIAEPRFVVAGTKPTPATPGHNVTYKKHHGAVAKATGPPPRAAMKIAA